MKRAIAIRCTQEQFDSIKDKIASKINSVTSFETYPYLINFSDSERCISNIRKHNYWDNYWNQNPEIHETFNADIFLEACGVEAEKVFSRENLQFRNPERENEWLDYTGNYEFRLKPQPDYSKEIEALQQKAKENGMSVELIWSKL